MFGGFEVGTWGVRVNYSGQEIIIFQGSIGEKVEKERLSSFLWSLWD